MANIVGNSVLNIDTTGLVVGAEVQINGIVVVANADTWSCVLKDIEGTVIFRADSAVTNKRTVSYSPAKSQPVKGINAITLTNIALVIVHLA